MYIVRVPCQAWKGLGYMHGGVLGKNITSLTAWVGCVAAAFASAVLIGNIYPWVGC